jgi:adenylate cyclase
MVSGSQELAVLHADARGYSATMAQSETLAITKLRAGNALSQQTANRFGGRIIDMAGDSVLLTFETVRAAFCAARHICEVTNFEKQMDQKMAPFDFRMGLTKGRVNSSGNRVFGHCVNMAARIGSLVGAGNIGVASAAWSEARPLTYGKTVRSRILFAKPDEPFIDFTEIIYGQAEADSFHSAESRRNAPYILLVPKFLNKKQGQEDSAIESIIWNCSAFFSSQGWQISTHSPNGEDISLSNSSAEYIVTISAFELSMGLRMSVSVSSCYIRQGVQHFTRDVNAIEQFNSDAVALASLTGSAITLSEMERVTDTRNVGSHQLVAAGRNSLSEFSLPQFLTGLEYMERAEKIDPEYPLLLSSLGRAHAVAWRFGWANTDVDHMELAMEYAQRAVRFSPNDSRCQADLGFVKFWNGEPQDAAWHYNRSLDALPFHPELSADAGMVYSYVANNEKAVSVLEHSIANLPLDADYRLWSLGDVYYAKKDYKNSLKWLQRMSDQTQAHRLLAANKARLGLDASAHVKNVLAQQPDFSVSHWIAIQPFTNEEDRIDYEEALLLAGLPR